MGRKSVSALKRKMHFVIRAWLEEAVIRCNGSSFFMLYQHPTPTPKSPLSPRGDFDFFFAAGCFGSGVRCALQSSTRLRYRSLQSLLMLALCRGKAMGLTILFPMEISALPKKRTVGSKPPTAFFVQPMLPWGNAPLRLRMGKRGYGDCASPNPCDLP